MSLCNLFVPNNFDIFVGELNIDGYPVTNARINGPTGPNVPTILSGEGIVNGSASLLSLQYLQISNRVIVYQSVQFTLAGGGGPPIFTTTVANPRQSGNFTSANDVIGSGTYQDASNGILPCIVSCYPSTLNVKITCALDGSKTDVCVCNFSYVYTL